MDRSPAPSPPTTGPHTQAAVQRLVDWYERLSPTDLPQLHTLYAADAHFKDPFNDVRGVRAIAGIYAHMFATLDRPRFVVTQQIVQGDQAFLCWEFRFHMRRWRPHEEQTVHGASLLRLDAEGRVTLHRDYWDTAEELYEKIPVLGSLMRWLRRTAR